MKVIYEIRLRPLNEHFFVMDLITSAGTYVKEFIHGDFGRTKPSFRDLLGGGDIRTDILQLDVMGIIEGKDGEEQKR
jgi:tRNA pseudouridine synthase 10